MLPTMNYLLLTKPASPVDQTGEAFLLVNSIVLGYIRFKTTRSRIRWDNKNDTILTIVPLGGSKGGSFEPPF